MPIDLYYAPGSPPCRFVMMVGAATHVEFNYIEVNLRSKEQLKPEFLNVSYNAYLLTCDFVQFQLKRNRDELKCRKL